MFRIEPRYPCEICLGNFDPIQFTLFIGILGRYDRGAVSKGIQQYWWKAPFHFLDMMKDILRLLSSIVLLSSGRLDFGMYGVPRC